MTNLLAPGATVGRYLIEREIGRGGMGVVYRAVDPSLNRAVALKMLGHHLVQDESARLRFHREAASAANLKHPHIALVYEFGEHEGQPFIALEWAEGETLAQVLAHTGPLPTARAFKIFDQLAEALDHAHAHGVIHRDFKPSNIIIGAEDRATLVDFGLAWISSAPAITMTSAFFGTPRYTAPEHIRGEKVNGQADIYSLGIVMYEMLSGRLPYPGETTASLLHHHLYSAPLPISELNPTVPPAFEAALLRALDKQPGARFRTAADFGRALRGEDVAQTWFVPETATTRAPRNLGDTAGTPPARRDPPVLRLPERRWWPVIGVGLASVLVIGFLATLINRPGAPAAGGAALTPDVATAQIEASQTAMAGVVRTAIAEAATPTVLVDGEQPPVDEAPTSEPTPTLIPTPINDSPSEDSSWWPVNSGTSARTGVYWGGFPVFDPNPRWQRYPRAGVTNPIIVGGDRLFVGLDDGSLAAIDWKNGLTDWRRLVAERVASAPTLWGDDTFYRLFAVVGYNVDTENYYEEVVAVDASSGEEVWRVGADQLGGKVGGNDVLLGGDRQGFVATETGNVHALSLDDGSVVWTLTIGEGEGFWQPPALHDRMLYLASSASAIYGINIDDPDAPAWAADTLGGPTAGPVLAPDIGLVFVGTNEGNLHAVWMDSGRLAWEAPARTTSEIMGLATDNTRVYATTADGTVYAFWTEDGSLAWAVNTGVEIRLSPLTDGTVIMVYTAAPDLRFIDVETGTEDESRRIVFDGGGWIPPTFAGGWLFIPDWDITALGPAP